MYFHNCFENVSPKNDYFKKVPFFPETRVCTSSKINTLYPRVHARWWETLHLHGEPSSGLCAEQYGIILSIKSWYTQIHKIREVTQNKHTNHTHAHTHIHSPTVTDMHTFYTHFTYTFYKLIHTHTYTYTCNFTQLYYFSGITRTLFTRRCLKKNPAKGNCFQFYYYM